jgi:putative transposase
VSERRACAALGADRSSVRYRCHRPDDGAVRTRLRELAAVRRRFGYRRLFVLMNHKKFRRLYREERLQVRRRGGRKRALGTRAPLTIPQGPNQRWSLDFLSDAFADGRRFRILVVVDDFTRECLALIADTSLPGLRVVRELETVVTLRGRARDVHLRQRHRADRPGGAQRPLGGGTSAGSFRLFAIRRALERKAARLGAFLSTVLAAKETNLTNGPLWSPT